VALGAFGKVCAAFESEIFRPSMRASLKSAQCRLQMNGASEVETDIEFIARIHSTISPDDSSEIGEKQYG